MSAILKNTVRFENRLQSSGKYWKYMGPALENHLSHYLPVFEKYRSDIGIIPEAEDWQALPFGKFADDASWKWRRESLQLLQQYTSGQTFETVLEIGAWNGWLTKYLARQSQAVIAADYFTHPFDGIGNIESLQPNITAVQCDVNDISTTFKKDAFDLIVLNHCLAYTGNPTDFISGLVPLLKPDGKIISLGNSWYKNPKMKKFENEKAERSFAEKYNMELYINPVKGFLDKNDVTLLKDIGFKIDAYPKRKPQNIYAKFNGTAPKYIAITYNV